MIVSHDEEAFTMEKNFFEYETEEDIIVKVDNLPPKKKGNFNKYIAVACCMTVLGGSSFGMGYGIGANLPKANADITAIQSDDIMFTSSSTNNIQNLNSAVDIVKSISNAVVSINIKMDRNNFYYATQDVGAGSGIIFYEDNEKIYIVTNNHVIEDATEVTISVNDTNEANANLVGTNSESDIAVISVKKSQLQNAGIANYAVAKFADSDLLEVGESVIAIGNAAGQGKSATYGIISAIDKQIDIDGKKLDVVQTDAAINPGNSGGALVNTKGQVVGVNTAKFGTYGIEGMGYSIPSNNVKKIAEGLIANGNSTSNKPYLGIQGITVDEQVKQYYDLPLGAYIGNVSSGSSAAKAGLLVGDVVVGFNDVQITTMEQLSEQIGKTKIGDKVKLSIYRKGKTQMTLDVVMNGKF
jgi:serine protease Do